jgi:hypothetical protein
MTTRRFALAALFITALLAGAVQAQDAAPAAGDTLDAALDVQPAAPALVGEPDAAPAPPLSPLDRSRWPVIVVGPADGHAHHGPVYFADLGDPIAGAALPQTRDTETRLAAALQGGKNVGLLDGDNLFHLAADPLKFGFDLATLPVALIVHPPCLTDTSPSSDGSSAPCKPCAACVKP